MVWVEILRLIGWAG